MEEQAHSKGKVACDLQGSHPLHLLSQSQPATHCLHACMQGKIGQTIFLSLIIGLIYLHISSSYTGVQDRQVNLNLGAKIMSSTCT